MFTARGCSLKDDVEAEFGLPPPPDAWSEQQLQVESSHPAHRAVFLRRSLERALPSKAVLLTDYYPILSTNPTIVTILDLRYAHGRDIPTLLRRAALRFQYRKGLGKTAAVLAGSETIKQEIVENFKVAPENIRVSYCGLSRRFRESPLAERSSNHLLAIGLSDPRKNAPVLLNAYRLAHSAGKPLPLVIAGYLSQPLQQLIDVVRAQTASDIRTPGLVSDEALVGLYRGAAALLHPSEYEGFGIPVLEASALGVPTIAARAAAVRELGSPLTRYVSTMDAWAWAEAILETSAHDGPDRLAQEEARRWSLRFTWEHVAEQVLNAAQTV